MYALNPKAKEELFIERLRERARKFTIDNFTNPQPIDFLLIENAMLAGSLVRVELEAEASRRRSSCTHKVLTIPGDYYAKDKWRSDRATCQHCGEYLGWYCPESKNHQCLYETHDDAWSECCLYCGMPDERK